MSYWLIPFIRRVGSWIYDFFILRSPFFDDGVVASESENIFGGPSGYFCFFSLLNLDGPLGYFCFFSLLVQNLVQIIYSI